MASDQPLQVQVDIHILLGMWKTKSAELMEQNVLLEARLRAAEQELALLRDQNP